MKTEVDQIRNELWDQLTELFRQRRDARDTNAPLGFATRVAARWQEMRQLERLRAWERISIRAAIGCALIAIAFTALTVSDSWQESSQSVLVSPPLELDESVTAVLVP